MVNTSTLLHLPPIKYILSPNRNFRFKDSRPKPPSGHGKGHSLPPRLEAKSKYAKKILHRFSAKHAKQTHLLLSGTPKKSDNFKLPLLSWHLTQPEIGQLQGAHSQLLEKRRYSKILCNALVFCWNQTPPEIGQLQGAHSQLL